MRRSREGNDASKSEPQEVVVTVWRIQKSGHEIQRQAGRKEDERRH
jgi:hypothetical protein